MQVEVGRKKRGAGRPPVGPNIVKDEDGNVYISNVVTTKPVDVPAGVEYVEVEADNGTIVWYEKSKPASRQSARKYKVVDGNLVDEGAAGRGRPAAGYVKITEDRTVDGVNLKGHFLFEEEEEVTGPVGEPVAEVATETEADRAAADALADIAAEVGEEFEEVEIEEEETV